MTIEALLQNLLDARRHVIVNPAYALNATLRCIDAISLEFESHLDTNKFGKRLRHNLEAACEFIHIDGEVLQSALYSAHAEIQRVHANLQQSKSASA